MQPIPPSAAAHLVPHHAAKGMYNRVETRPGLDALAANTSGLESALGPLLAWAKAVVPPRQHASTPLFLLGTGGLRRLPAQRREGLFATIRRQLAQSGFRCVAARGTMGVGQGVVDVDLPCVKGCFLELVCVAAGNCENMLACG